MILTRHEPGNCETHAYPIAISSIECFFKSFHGSFLVSQRAESLASGDEYCALSSLLIRYRRLR